MILYFSFVNFVLLKKNSAKSDFDCMIIICVNSNLYAYESPTFFFTLAGQYTFIFYKKNDLTRETGPYVFFKESVFQILKMTRLSLNCDLNACSLYALYII